MQIYDKTLSAEASTQSRQGEKWSIWSTGMHRAMEQLLVILTRFQRDVDKHGDLIKRKEGLDTGIRLSSAPKPCYFHALPKLLHWLSYFLEKAFVST